MLGFYIEFLVALVDAGMWYGIAAVEFAGVDDDVGIDAFDEGIS